MAQVRLKLEGMEQLQRQLAKAPDVVRKHVSTSVGLSTLRVMNRAKALVPVGATGILKREIDHDHKDGSLTGWVGIRSSAAFYWRFVEFGTQHVGARPFFRPAAEENQQAFIRDVQNAGPDIEDEMERSA